MKKFALSLFIFCGSAASFCQNHSLGIKTGLVDVDLVQDYGLNLEFFYERKLIKNLFIGIDFGIANQNNFPKFFDPRLERVNNVPPEVDTYIRGLSQSDAMFLRWQTYSVDYTQLYVKYTLPFKLLSSNINLYTGGMIQRSQYDGFSLKEFIIQNGRVAEYTPSYVYSTDTGIGWMLGVGVSRPLPKNFTFEIDAKYNIPEYDHFNYVLGLLRIGISKSF
jgi:hypothetical protein